MDPMVGSGGKRSRSGINSVGGAGINSPPEEENSNSNVVSLLEVCFLCNRRFLYDLTSDPSHNLNLKEEDILLHLFFEDTSALEKSMGLLQCCSFCKILCNSLLEAKTSLSKIIDEISSLLQKSKKLNSNSSSYMLSKGRVITRLFQDQPNLDNSFSNLGNLGNLSQIHIQLDSDFINNSNSGFPNRFEILLNPSNSNTDAGDTSNAVIIDVDQNFQNSGSKEPNPSFNFIAPSNGLDQKGPSPKKAKTGSFFSKKLSNKLNSISNGSKSKTSSELIPKSSFKNVGTNEQNMIDSKSVGTLVPIHEHIYICNLPNFEENARDVEDSDDNHSHNRRPQNEHILPGPKPAKDGDIITQPPQPIIVDDNYSGRGIEDNSTNSKMKFGCQRCSKGFKSSRDLRNHIRSHTQEKPYICEICGVGYRQKRGLEMHVGLHKGESRFECEHCHKVFTQKSGLRRHLPLHTGETVFQCDHCGKGFVHHSSFAHHKLTHSGEKRFQCDICDLFFFTSSHLKRHQRTHTGEKPFKCDLCKKSFNEKSNLKAHQRVHTKVPAHQCPECQMGFDRKHKLSMHLTVAHPSNAEEDFGEYLIKSNTFPVQK